jgi:hypothetical protein
MPFSVQVEYVEHGLASEPDEVFQWVPHVWLESRGSDRRNGK